MTGRGAAQQARLVKDMLLELAEHLETRRPDEPLTAVGRHAVIQATTLDPALAPALRAQCPEITDPVIRRDYAAQLRKIAEGGPR